MCLTYYIKSSDDAPCPVSTMNCSTMTVFAERSYHRNTSLILLRGNHSLDKNLSIAGIPYFTISVIQTGNATIECHESARIIFSSVSIVRISHVNFVNCIEIEINNVHNLLVQDVVMKCTMSIFGSAMIVKSSNVHFSNSSFLNFFGTLRKHVLIFQANIDQASVGGVMILSSSSVEINHCIFENNNAELGGVAFAQNYSSISINDSRFINHSISCKKKCNCLGGLIFLNNSKASINHSLFLRNVLNHSQPRQVTRGGVIVSFDSSVSVGFADFQMNFAYMGAVIESRHSNVSFYECSFLNNTAKLNGGIGLFKTSTVFVKNCNFTGNKAFEKAGGVFYAERSRIQMNFSYFYGNEAYNLGGVTKISKSNVFVTDCTFIANSATSEVGRGGVMYYAKNNFAELCNTKFYSNRAYGGGAVSSNTGSVLHLKSNNLLIGNSAHYGGAIQVQFSIFTCNCTLSVISNTGSWGALTFLHSNGKIDGKFTYKNNTGSLLAFDSEISAIGDIQFKNSAPEELSGNYAGVNEGGGITSILSTVHLQGKVKFSHNQAINGGGIVAISSRIVISGQLSATDNYVSDTGGGVYAYHSVIIIVHGKAALTNNRAFYKGGGIHLVSSSLVLVTRNKDQSSIDFNSNLAKLGGGVCLEESSKLYTTTDEVVIEFTSNKADFGGAIYVSDDTNNGTCTSNEGTLTNTAESDCFFQSVRYNPYGSNSRTSNTIKTHISFSGNTANISGAFLYGGLLDRCTVNVFERKAYIKIMYSSQPNFTEGILNYTSSDAVRICFCETKEAEVDCSYQPNVIQVVKGRNFTLNVAAVDHVNHTLNHVTIHSYLSHKDSRFGKGQKAQTTDSVSLKCSVLTFRSYTALENETMIMYPSGPCRDASKSRRTVRIEFLPCVCPVGFEPSRTDLYTCNCECHPKLLKFVTSCNKWTALVHRKGDAWITALNYSNNTDYFIHPHCPFDYCLPPTVDVGINFTVPTGSDAQCNHHRSGLLCSMCKPGLSLSLGSSQCVPCPKYWPAVLLIIILSALLAGVILVWLVLVLNLTVAIGTLNGIVFYANVIAANKSIFLPFQNPNFHSVVVSWLNLDIGFNTCFFEGMDAYTKTWIEFLFSVYVIALVAGVILICEYSEKFASLLGKRNPIATLATLILFSYSKLLQSIIYSLAFTVLKYPDGSKEVVWRPDATVKYFSGKHIPLLLVALLILLSGMVYTVLLFFWQWLLQVSNIKAFHWVKNTKLISFMDAYHAPFTAKSRYWTGLLLLARVVLYTVSAVNVSGEPGINLITVIVVITCLFMLKFNIYKQWPIDVLETGLYINLILLSAGKLYILYNELDNHCVLAYISVSMTIVMLVCVIFYHIILCNPSIKLWISRLKLIVVGVPRPNNENLMTNLLENDSELDSCIHNITFSEVEIAQPMFQHQSQSRERETREKSIHLSSMYTITT